MCFRNGECPRTALRNRLEAAAIEVRHYDREAGWETLAEMHPPASSRSSDIAIEPLPATATPPSRPARAWSKGRGLALAGLVTAAAVLPVWSVTYPPLQDYPYHLVRGQMLSHWEDPRFVYSETFTRDLFPTPYILVDYLLGSLGALVPVTVAGKIVLTLCVGLLPWGLWWLLTGVDPARAPLALLGIPLAYSWHFHMGFLNYSLSLAAALFAFGWWWRMRDRAGWRAVAVLAILVTLVYLLHLYTWGILLLALGAMAVAAPPERRLASLGRLGLAYLPGLALLAALLARAPREGEGHAWLLFYGNPLQRAELLLGGLVSFSMAWEGALMAVLVALGALLALTGWRRGFPRELLGGVAALALLFLLLPDHVGEVYFVSNRVPLLLFLLAVPLLALPAEPWRRRLAIAALAGVALLHLAGTFWRYQQIDHQLAAYARVLEAAPADERLGFRAHRPSMREGRIAPAAIFGGYHYLRAPGHLIPDLEHFVGFLRPVAYRERQEEVMSTAAVRTPEALSSLLGRRYLAGTGGLLVAVGGSPEERRQIDGLAAKASWRRLAAVGPAAVHLRSLAPGSAFSSPGEAVGTAPWEPIPEDWYATGYLEGYDFLAIYSHRGISPPPEAEGLELVLREGPAALYARP